MTLRSTLNREEQNTLVGGPTRFKKSFNQSELMCGYCGALYYVDDVTFDQAMSAMEEGVDNTFCCDDCEADYEDLTH